jgi:hypothetical protein
VLATVLVIAGGCAISEDDEMVPPTRTVMPSPTPTPTPAPAAVPDEVPVGEGPVSTTDPVWAQDTLLHVGTRQVDVAPHRIESLVVVSGGVYLLDRGEVWFTDLTRLRGTGLSGATRLSSDREGGVLLVEVGPTAGSAKASQLAFDTRTGASVSPTKVRAATVEDRLGEATQVELRPERSDVTTTSPRPLSARRGPGPFGVVGGDGEPLLAFDATTRQRVPLTGVAGDGFELVRWTSGTDFYGLALDRGDPAATLACDLTTRACRSFGTLERGRAVVFESGT